MGTNTRCLMLGVLAAELLIGLSANTSEVKAQIRDSVSVRVLQVTPSQVWSSVLARVTSTYTREGLPGISVTLSDTARGFRTRVTDWKGEALMEDLPPGSSHMWILGSAGDTLGAEIFLLPGETQEVEFRMTPPWVPYPEPIRPGTPLDSLRRVFSDSLALLPPRDGEDRVDIPLWFRAFERHMSPHLPRAGPYQYPHATRELYQWMLAHPDLPWTRAEGRSALNLPGGRTEVFRAAALHAMEDGHAAYEGPFPSGGGQGGDARNVRLTESSLEHRETSVAVDPANPRWVIAGANNIRHSPATLMMFRSSDGGRCWNSGLLTTEIGPGEPLVDPSVAWGPDGTAWTATLLDGMKKEEGKEERIREIRLYRSRDRGATWGLVGTVSEGNGNDKPMVTVGPGARRGESLVHVVWGKLDRAGIHFRSFEPQSEVWSKTIRLTDRLAFGAHVAAGSGGVVVVAWYQEGEPFGFIQVAGSRDGGGTFSEPFKLAAVRALPRMRIPAACRQLPFVYPVVALDPRNSSGAQRAYVAWTDLGRDDTSEPGCSLTSGFPDLPQVKGTSSDVFLSIVRFHDNGTFQVEAGPKVVNENENLPETDQFNPWIAVDPEDATLSIAYYDTPAERRASVRVRLVSSGNGGNSFDAPITVTTRDSRYPKASSGHQWGDYSGLAVVGGRAITVWTDHRWDSPEDKTKIYSSVVSRGNLVGLACQPAEIQFLQRSPRRIRLGEHTRVGVRVTREGRPLAGEWVRFEASSHVITPRLASRITGDDGAVELEIEGLNRGEASLSASVGGSTAVFRVEIVPAPSRPAWLWLILPVLVAVALLGIRFRRRSTRS